MKPMTEKQFETAAGQTRCYGRSLAGARLVLVEGKTPTEASVQLGISQSAIRRTVNKICPEWKRRYHKLTQSEFDHRVKQTRFRGKALEAAKRVLVNREVLAEVVADMGLSRRPVQRIVSRLLSLR